MQYPDDEHLKLLFEYGLGKGSGRAVVQAGSFRRTGHTLLRHAARRTFSLTTLRWAISANYVSTASSLLNRGTGADANAS